MERVRMQMIADPGYTITLHPITLHPITLRPITLHPITLHPMQMIADPGCLIWVIRVIRVVRVIRVIVYMGMYTTIANLFLV